jgi:hypothetical protein
MTFDAPNTRSSIIVQKRLKNDQVNLPIEKCYRVRHLILIKFLYFAVMNQALVYSTH